MKTKNLETFQNLESVNILNTTKSEKVVGGKAAAIVAVQNLPIIVIAEDFETLIVIADDLETLVIEEDLIFQ